MTELQWLTSTDGVAMLHALQSANGMPLAIRRQAAAGRRKLQLFFCAGVRSFFSQMEDAPEWLLPTIHRSEAIADGKLTPMDIAPLRLQVDERLADCLRHDPEWLNGKGRVILNAAFLACRCLPLADRWDSPDCTLSADLVPASIQADLLREIFGNPFRSIVVDRAWLVWNDRTIPRLAQTIYEQRRWDLIPQLGDAFEEAGCMVEEVLEHCRQGLIWLCGKCRSRVFRWKVQGSSEPWVACPRCLTSMRQKECVAAQHARGCWLLDLVLGERLFGK